MTYYLAYNTLFKLGDEEGRDFQLTIDNEVDEDRWIFDLHR